MRRTIAAIAAGVLLAGPTLMAFLHGGVAPQFAVDRNEERLAVSAAMWALVLVAAIAAEWPLPRRWAGRAALAGLALLTLWTGLSLLWAPLRDPASDDLQRVVLYLGAFAAAVALLRGAGVRRALEPALALGVLAVVGYGLSERLLPGVFELERSTAADGRLEQPLTYWNTMGALAALGVVLCVRLAGDFRRPVWMRAAAAAGCAPLAAGVVASVSRGALGALAAGLLALAALALTRPQLRAFAACGLPAAAAGAVAAALPAVRALEGSDGAREREGLAMLGVLAVAMALSAVAQWWLARRERAGTLAASAYAAPRWVPAAGVVLVIAVAGLGVVAAATDRGPRAPSPTGADPDRLRSFESNRYEYWDVALGAFAGEPLNGLGASGFSVEWLRERDIAERVRDAHSLFVETLAELGIVGFALLMLWLGGVAACARISYRGDPGFAAGPIAASLVWVSHAAVDWDWELPGFTLFALLLMGALVAAADDAGTSPDAALATEPALEPEVAAAR